MSRKNSIKVLVSKDAEPVDKKYIKALSKTINKWIDILRLDHWLIVVQIVHQSEIEKGYIADIIPDYEYLQAYMRVSKELKYDDFDTVICHELLHVVLGIIRDKLKYIQERITDKEKKLFYEAEENAINVLSRVLVDIVNELEKGGDSSE